MAGKAVAKAQETALALPEDLIVPEGAGLEQADRESYAIPFLTILQKGSPQVDPDNGEYIEGAKAGMFLDTVSDDVLDPEKEALRIIPVYYRRAFIEWKPRDAGGGFVGEHTVAEAENLRWERNDKGQDVLPNGNQIVDTRYHYVILVREDGTFSPMVITMSSTQVKKSKRLCSDLDLQVRSQGLKATFQLMYQVRTVSESNEHGTWRGWDIKRSGLVTDQEQLNAAIAFYKAIKSGDIKEATDSLNPTGTTAEHADNGPAF